MSFKEPNFIHVMLLSGLGVVARPFYRRFVDSMHLKGNERVLDFGSGAGGSSVHIAQTLLKGNGRLTCVDMSRVWMRIIKKRLKAFPNVEFKLGDVSEIDIESSSYDAVVIHFVLHDVEQDLRQRTLDALSRALKDTGRIYIKEPLGKRHGMPAEEIRGLMTQIGLKEIDFKILKSFAGPPGPKYMGIFAKVCGRQGL
jgi:ubiquinone/menaquinone biosynthesis C-methylase UbiE